MDPKVLRLFLVESHTGSSGGLPASGNPAGKKSQLLLGRLLLRSLLGDLLSGFLSCLLLGHGISSVQRFTPLLTFDQTPDREPSQRHWD